MDSACLPPAFRLPSACLPPAFRLPSACLPPAFRLPQPHPANIACSHVCASSTCWPPCKDVWPNTPAPDIVPLPLIVLQVAICLAAQCQSPSCCPPVDVDCIRSRYCLLASLHIARVFLFLWFPATTMATHSNYKHLTTAKLGELQGQSTKLWCAFFWELMRPLKSLSFKLLLHVPKFIMTGTYKDVQRRPYLRLD
jgi:hypothetical protein